MNVESNIALKKIAIDDPLLPYLIKFSIGSSTNDKILEIIKSYQNANQQLIGAILNEQLIGVVGFEQATEQITIRHISVLPEFQRQGVGKALIGFVKKKFTLQKIVIETDKEAVGFYQKFNFVCNPFQGKYGNLRYKCVLENKL